MEEYRALVRPQSADGPPAQQLDLEGHEEGFHPFGAEIGPQGKSVVGFDFLHHAAVARARPTWIRLCGDLEEQQPPSLLPEHALVCDSVGDRLYGGGSVLQPLDG